MNLPAAYEQMTDAELEAAIWQAKLALGADLTILGHHYQRDEIIQFADYRGDSLGLSQRAATTTAKYIVFCGVYFMAETAAILAQPGQVVCQPAIEAMCPMARMANRREAQLCWDALSSLWPGDIIPITYQNSTAEVKAFVGEHGGAVCTSSNARPLLEWAWGQKGHVLFMPDEHLGTNTALAMGVSLSEIGLWDWANPPQPETLRDCRLVAWKGFCYVHAEFTPEDVRRMRAAHPGAIVVVHPECPREVVALADATGSTTGILDFVARAPAGATVVVGTEWHLVNRLRQQFTDRTVLPLAERACRTMAMTRLKHLWYVLDSLLQGEPRHVVSVDTETARWARVALNRMLEAG
jgi:quinolinate synthase